eukprot:scaffold7378_cov410-Prasinococcus_capsulatus_cf.AAC.4
MRLRVNVATSIGAVDAQLRLLREIEVSAAGGAAIGKPAVCGDANRPTGVSVAGATSAVACILCEAIMCWRTSRLSSGCGRAMARLAEAGGGDRSPATEASDGQPPQQARESTARLAPPSPRGRAARAKKPRVGARANLLGAARRKLAPTPAFRTLL